MALVRNSEVFTASDLALSSCAILVRSYLGSEEVKFAVVPCGSLDGKAVPYEIQVPLCEKSTELVHRARRVLTECIAGSLEGLAGDPAASNTSGRALHLCLDLRAETTSAVETHIAGLVTGAVVVSYVASPSGTITYNLRCDSPTQDGLGTTDSRIDRYVDALSHITLGLSQATEECRVADVIQRPLPRDLQEIWATNMDVAESPQTTLHELFAIQARSRPTATAIEAWDGQMSYERLDELSTQLAHLMQTSGARPGSCVGLGLGRSMWLVVGMLAVMKVGCAFVPFDPDWPVARRDRVMHVTKCAMLLTSTSLSLDYEGDVKISILRLPDCLEHLIEGTQFICPSVGSSTAAYVLFTSGSTGDPKGVVIEHGSIIISMRSNAAQLGIGEHTRMLQFAAPTFDISIVEIMGTLLFGGCVFVPCDADRKTRLPEYMVEMQINHAALTPTVARLLVPEDIPCLRTLVLGGEPVLMADVKRWRRIPNLFNGYGPTECAVCCALQRINEAEPGAPAIGRLQGVPLWVVDPTDHNVLLPIGAMGELIVEGLTVGREYLGDKKSTAEAFLANPSWLTLGCGKEFPGRQGRIYKTGDLVRYDELGHLRYVGRKASDLQVKVRGQRLDLMEVESHLCDYCVPMGAEAVVVDVSREGIIADTKTTTLAAVLCFSPDEVGLPDGQSLAVMLPTKAAPIQAHLAERLPAYAVPTTFLRIAALPTTASDKVDRRRIRTLVGDLLGTFSDQMASKGSIVRPPATAESRGLREIWARVLQIPVDRIGADDNFLQLGGDSIAAIAIVREVRLRLKLHLTIAQLFQSPTLEMLAASMNATSVEEEPILAYSLLQAEDIDMLQLRHDVAKSSGLQGPASVLDAYPCTPLHETLLSLSALHVGAYTIQRVLRLHDGVDLRRLMEAWEEVARQTCILTTRITQHPQLGLVNVVSSDPIEWTHLSVAELESYLRNDRETPFGTDQPLMRCAVAHADSSLDSTGTHQYFVCTMHHALYDGWSMPLLWDRLLRAYRGEQLEPSRFAPFIKWCQYSRSHPSARSYWTRVLHDLHSATLFPSLPTSVSDVREDSRLEHQWPLPECSGSGITRANLIAAAWAIVAGHYSGSHDVLFGVTVSGRNAPVLGIDHIVGSTIATVPHRVQYRADQLVAELLQTVQEAAVERIPFEQTGLAQISAYGLETRKVRDIQTFIVVQPAEYGGSDFEEVGQWVNGPGNYHFDPSALTLEVFLKKEEIRCVAHFDSHVIEHRTTKRCLSQLAHVSQQLNAAPSGATVGSIQLLTLSDVREIWALNEKLLQPDPQALPHHEIAIQAKARPMAPAVHAHDGTLSYGQLWAVSSLLAQRLVASGVGPGHHIPLFLEPSSWVAVSMIAVLRTGASFVPISPDLPDARVKQMLLKLEFPVYISSALLASRGPLCETGNAILLPPPQADGVMDVVVPDEVEPSSPAWVIFTSGSTGTPKGVVISHLAAHTSFQKLGAMFELGPHTRTLQFSSLAFDACVLEIVGTLLLGGCVCIPAPDVQQSTTDMPSVIQAMRVNTAILTPSVARQLNPREILRLDTLVLTGEAPVQNDLERWGHIPRLFNAYGPAECSNMCAVRRICSNTDDPLCIGSLSGVANWVVHPEDPDQLSPIGGVGELIVGGATVGSGYLRDAEKTAAAFVQNLAWFAHGPPQVPRPQRLYRTGDLVRLNHDGSLTYRGRKDGQVKIRGQRVELGDIEHHVMRLWRTPEAVAELVEVAIESSQQQLLVVFLRDSNPSSVPLLHQSHAIIAQLEATLPRYMVPSYVIRVPSFPSTLSGKTDRATLRMLAQDLIQEHWRNAEHAGTPPWTAKRAAKTWAEGVLIQAWEQALGKLVAGASIGLDDDFVQLGGSSIDALKVVSACRRMGLALTVADVLRFRSLEAQAARGKRVEAKKNDDRCANDEQERQEPFLLVAHMGDAQQLRADVAAACEVTPEAVQDVYPCVPLQIGLMSATARDVAVGAYILRHTFAMPAAVDMSRMRRAWAETVRTTDVLRTRIIHHPTAGWVQVVIEEEVCWHEGESGVREDMKMALGRQLSTLQAIRGREADAGWTLVWTVHHAVADGWTLELVLDKVRRAYDGLRPLSAAPSQAFRHFVHWFCTKRSDEEAVQYWRDTLAGVQASAFPQQRATAAATGTVVEDSGVEHCCSVPTVGHATFTTLARAAWALVQCRHAMSRDVVFAEVRSGRTVDLLSADVVIGPMLATVPFRARIDEGATVRRFLDHVNQAAVGSIAHEHLGWRQIARINHDCAAACAAAQTLIAIQPSPQPRKTSSVADSLFHEPPQYRLVDYALCLEIVPEEPQPPLRGAYRKVRVHARFNSRVISAPYVRRVLRQFAHALVELATLPCDAALSRTSILPPDEIEQIWNWSASESSAPDKWPLLHYTILQNAQQWPQALAVQAWDGNLTYSELARLSRALARQLRRRGVGTVHCFVPWYMEKSRWSVVAFLAILQTGAAILCLDPAHPFARTGLCLSSSLPEAAEGAVAVVSSALAPRWRHLPNVQLIELCDEFFHTLRRHTAADEEGEDNAATAWNVAPTAPCWVIYTSGSTGRPKGVVIEHRSPANAFPRFSRMLQLGTSTRMLQFASHAFDVTTWEITAPLLVGGTCVVPSDTQRLQALPAFCAEFRPNTAFLTPAILRVYPPYELSTLQVLLVGGAAPSEKDFHTWCHLPALYNAYGPTEATVFSALSRVSKISPGRAARRLDRISGIELWVCDPNNPNVLAPIGTIGELVIQSPTLARGYLDAEQTADAFVESPDWLAEGLHGLRPGQRAKVYRTGDMARLDEHGELHYMGRRDKQIKIRGQRVELADIERNIVDSVSDITWVAVIAESDRPHKLAAFVQLRMQKLSVEDNPVPILPYQPSSAAKARLRDRLPAYMLPHTWIAVDKFPLTTSGKVDEGELQAWTKAFHKQELDRQRTVVKYMPTTSLEKALHQSWVRVLSLDKDAIDLDSNFFGVGGDSISSLELVAELRRNGIELGVTDVYQNPILRDLTKHLESRALSIPMRTQVDEILPFTLLPTSLDRQQIAGEIATLCSTSPESIEDIYPCTAMQAALLAMTAQHPGAYLSRYVLELGPDRDVGRFRTAWQDLLRMMPILRTHVLSHWSAGFLQVVMRAEHAELVEKQDMAASCTWHLTAAHDDVPARFVLEIHHALYDRVTLQLMVDCLDSLYRGAGVRPLADYRTFIKHLPSGSVPASEKFWRSTLDDFHAPIFPSLPFGISRVIEDSALTSTFTFPSVPIEVTRANVLRAAWSLAVSWYTGQEDVIFGDVRSGRDANLVDIKRMPGPTIATVPLPVRADSTLSVREYLRQVQHQVSLIGSHEQFGLHRIRGLSSACANACRFQTLFSVLVGQVRTRADSADDDQGLKAWSSDSTVALRSFALVVESIIERDNYECTVKASFDSRVISAWTLGKVIDLFGSLVIRLTSFANDDALKLYQLETISDADRRLISGDDEDLGGKRWLVCPHDARKLAPLGAVGELIFEHKQHVRQDRAPFKVDINVPWLDGCLTGTLWSNGELARYEQGHGLIHVGWKNEAASQPNTFPGPGDLDSREINTVAMVRTDGIMSKPRTKTEKLMADLWAESLRLDAINVRREHSFFLLGGDSVSCISLVSKCRAHGLSISVPDLLRYPRLMDLAAMADQSRSWVHEESDPPFSLLFEGEKARAQVEILLATSIVPAIGCAPAEVEDVLPCTYMQEEFLHMDGLKHHLQLDFLKADIDAAVLQQAVLGLLSRHSALRTVFTHDHEHGYVQVVLRSGDPQVYTNINLGEEESIDGAAVRLIEMANKSQQTALKQTPRFILLSRSNEGEGEIRLLILNLSHAQFDGFSLPLIVRDLATLYETYESAAMDPAPPVTAAQLSPASQFSEVIYGRSHSPTAKVRMHWARLLARSSAVPLFTNVSPQASEQEDSKRTRDWCRATIRKDVSTARWNSICKPAQISHTDVGLSKGCSYEDVLTAAWAVATAFVGQSDDVLFGRVVNGRRALTNNIASGENIVGPLMNIIPVRVELPLHHNRADFTTLLGAGRQPTLREFLSAVATQNTRSVAYEQTDLDEIATQFAAPGLWPEVPNASGNRKRFRWDSIIVWQDYRRLQAVDDVLPNSDNQSFCDTRNIARGYMSPFASSSQINFAGRLCSVTSAIPTPDLANVTIIGQIRDDDRDTVSLTLEYDAGSIASDTAQLLAHTVVATINIMSTEPDILLHELVAKLEIEKHQSLP